MDEIITESEAETKRLAEALQKRLTGLASKAIDDGLKYMDVGDIVLELAASMFHTGVLRGQHKYVAVLPTLADYTEKMVDYAKKERGAILDAKVKELKAARQHKEAEALLKGRSQLPKMPSASSDAGACD
jgi:hypothetical protein